MEPQLAMKVISSFDRAITEVLASQVKARLNFKVEPSQSATGLQLVLTRSCAQGSPGYVSVLR